MLNIYRLEPIAAPDDFRWDNAPSHGTVLVAARTVMRGLLRRAPSWIFKKSTHSLPKMCRPDTQAHSETKSFIP